MHRASNRSSNSQRLKTVNFPYFGNTKNSRAENDRLARAAGQNEREERDHAAALRSGTRRSGGNDAVGISAPKGGVARPAVPALVLEVLVYHRYSFGIPFFIRKKRLGLGLGLGIWKLGSGKGNMKEGM